MGREERWGRAWHPGWCLCGLRARIDGWLGAGVRRRLKRRLSRRLRRGKLSECGRSRGEVRRRGRRLTLAGLRRRLESRVRARLWRRLQGRFVGMFRGGSLGGELRGLRGRHVAREERRRRAWLSGRCPGRRQCGHHGRRFRRRLREGGRSRGVRHKLLGRGLHGLRGRCVSRDTAWCEALM